MNNEKPFVPAGTSVDDIASYMEAVGGRNEIEPTQADAVAAAGGIYEMLGTEHLAFQDMACESFPVILTGERYFNGCLMFPKGVIPPEE
jgi:L-fucose mutarotase/ribose pyranase (RbsD/FucU family)